MILRHLYCFLPEESDKLDSHAGVIQVTLMIMIMITENTVTN